MQLNAAEDPEMAALLGSYGDMAAKRLGFVPGTTPTKQRPALPQTPLHPQRIPMPTPPEGYRFAGITDGPLLLHENLLVWWDTLSICTCDYTPTGPTGPSSVFFPRR